jgi:SAM-dependent methyltransferase/uncharacterized protein YbaR (Trm112 family)
MSSQLVVCPGCRTATADRIDVRTLERAGDVLACECGRRYPIVDGVPIVMNGLADFLHGELATVVERDLPTEVAALLVEGGGDDAPYAQLLEHLSIYLDSHWGDHAEPPADDGGLAAIIDRLALLPRVSLAVELGCSVGRVVAELARRAEHVVGLDLQFGAVRRARRILDGERLPYNRRIIGRRYMTARVSAGDRAAPGVTLLCGDALDPPLIPRSYDRVVALNLLDSISNPRQLLTVMDALCATGGELILSSPYTWKSSVMADADRLGDFDPAAAVRAILRDGTELMARYAIEDEAELPWTLRRDARSSLSYRAHYIRARKLTGPS